MRLLHHQYYFHLFTLRNKEIDALYIALALINFAVGLISIFVPVYFWELGIPLWQIIFFYFLRAVYYVALTFLLLPIIKRLSDKIMMFLGIPFLVLYFIGLGFMGSTAWLFYVLPAALALYALFFNVGYHMDFSLSADDGRIGEEIGLGMAIIGMLKFATPFLGGLLILFVGFSGTFVVASSILLLAVIPFFLIKGRKFSPDISVSSVIDTLRDKTFKYFHIAMVGYVINAVGTGVLWPLFLFFIIGSIEGLGGLISLGLLLGVATTFVVGKLADKHMGKGIMSVAAIGEAVVWFVRAVTQQFPVIVGSHIASAMFKDALLPIWTRTYYTLLRTKKKLGMYVLGQEASYNIIRMVVHPILMLMAYMLPLDQFFTVSFLLIGAASFLFMAINHSS